jgi:hypothetical protein
MSTEEETPQNPGEVEDKGLNKEMLEACNNSYIWRKPADDYEFKNKFEVKFCPEILAMSNPEKAEVGPISFDVTPEFESRNSGIFMIIRQNDECFLFPRWVTNIYELPQIRACYDVEFVGKGKVHSGQKIEKPAVCSKTEQGWILKQKGKMVIEREE